MSRVLTQINEGMEDQEEWINIDIDLDVWYSVVMNSYVNILK